MRSPEGRGWAAAVPRSFQVVSQGQPRMLPRPRLALNFRRLRKIASGCGTSDHVRSLFGRGGEGHDMHRLVLFALAIPLACLALLCWVAFLGVVMIAVGMYMVGTIKSLEAPRSRALPS